jgi:hypothetical protein
MAFKPITIIYNSKNYRTGLTDVVGEVYYNQAAVAVGGSAIAFTELDATNAPGTYYAVISGANQTTYSAANGGIISVYVNSVTAPAAAEFKQIVTSESTDDLAASLATLQTTANTISTNVSTILTDVGVIESDVTDATIGLAAIKTAINNLSSQVSSVQNNTSFVCLIPENGFVLPVSGSVVYQIPINVCNASGSVADPDSNTITISLVNVSGTDEGSILTGYVAPVFPATVGTAPAVRVGTGQYYIDLTLPSTFTPQELIFSFAYTISSSPYNFQRGALIVTNVQADGFALQSTLLAVQTTVNDVDTVVNNGTYGLAALEALLTNGTFGLSAIETTATANNTLLTNATYGLSALNTSLVAIEGSGFSSTTNSLTAISTYLTANLYAGGKVI